MVNSITGDILQEKGQKQQRRNVLAVIIAHGPVDQLLSPLAGHPLIAYSIVAAMQAESVASLVVAGDVRLKDTINQYARIQGRDDIPVECVPFPGASHLDQIGLDYALKVGKQWLRNHPDPRIDIVLGMSPYWPLHPRGSLENAIDHFKLHADSSRAISLFPAGRGNHWWTIEDQGNLVQVRFSKAGKTENQFFSQSGHFVIMRLDYSKSSQTTMPILLDPDFGVTISQPSTWKYANWLVQFSCLDLVYPGHRPRPLPGKVDLLVLDFDGVLSDNRVWVDENGREQIASDRADSLGLFFLRQAGIAALVISMETNPVVAARCRKMNVPFLQGINDKASVLSQYLAERSINPQSVVYLGNDVNDLPCFPLVACAVAVADSLPAVLRQADLVLSHRGGHAAVRELCDLLINQVNKKQ